MSRSQPTLENPSERFFQWSGSKGTVYYWDKEQKEEVEVGPPFAFLMLDSLVTIKGYNERDEVGIWSNEIRSLNRQPLMVKTFEGTEIAQGLYDNIKDTIKARGGKFANSVYIAYRDNGEMKIGNFTFVGSSLGPWIDLRKEVGVQTLEQKAVVITGSKKEQKGGTEYFVPKLRIKDLDNQKDHQKAASLDKELQRYLEYYFKQRGEEAEIELEEDPQEDWAQEEPESLGGNLYDEPNDNRPQPPLQNEPVGSEVDMNEAMENIEDDLPF